GEEDLKTMPEKEPNLTTPLEREFTPLTSRNVWIKKTLTTPSCTDEKERVKTEVKQEPFTPVLLDIHRSQSITIQENITRKTG
ncbi:hypothetical protein ACJMK2_006216, partial [Sinanodonta woodiana]